MTSGVIGNLQRPPKQTLPSQPSQYNNGHVNKKRRATTSKVTGKQQPQPPPPLPTPSSATHPPLAHTPRPSDGVASETNSSPCDTRSVAADSGLSPLTPPLQNTGLAPPNTNSTSLALPFSPNFAFSPLPQFASLAPSPVPRTAKLNPNQDDHAMHFDPMLSMPTPYDQQPTPGAGSTSGASVHTDPDSKDPFLSLLEQLAENEVSRGGPSELDFFLSGQSG